jgi:hypothetical protein
VSARVILLAMAIVVAGSAAAYSLRPDTPPAVDFVDRLSGPTSEHFNIPFDKYTLTPEGLLRHSSASKRNNGIDRPVVRTYSDKYLSRDFVFEVDVTFPADVQDIAFVGWGDGTPSGAYQEPSGAFGFRIHHLQDNRDVRLAVMRPADVPETAYEEQTIGVVPANGSLTVRLERSGDQLIGSLPGQPGTGHTLRISAFPLILKSGRGFLYLGNTAEGTVFSNVRVRPRT